MGTSARTFLVVGFVHVLVGCQSQNDDSQGSTSGASGGASAAGHLGGSANTNAGGSAANPGGNGSSAGGSAALVGGNGSVGGAGSGTAASGGQSAACKVCGPQNCGVMPDGCGSLLDCGMCTTGTCGKTTPNVCDSCTPKTCTELGFDCGAAADGCGGLLSCGTCTGNLVCGIGGPNVCGDPTGGTGPTECLNFCKQQTSCPAGSLTSITGTVYAPSGNPAIDTRRGEAPLPLPNAFIYVPNGSLASPWGLTTFADGVSSASACSCEIQGNPLVSTTSDTDGSFTLTGVPVGQNIPLVIQLGRWRRVITIPNVPACATTTLTAEQTRLPRRQAEGHAMDAIPKMAISTGDVDAMECVLRKMGVEDSQFSNPGGTGRVQFYQDNGGICTNGGGSCSGTTPPYTQLTGNQATIDGYDALIFPCRAAAHDIEAARKSRVLDVATNTNAYVNKGGRAFFTHYSYSWLYNIQPSMQLPWPSTTNTNQVNTQWTTEFGAVDTSFDRGQVFAEWLGLPIVGGLTASTPVPYITINDVRRDMANPVNWPNGVPAERWLYAYNSRRSPGDAIFHVTFDTPWGLPDAQQCGRVLYSSFHVTGANTEDEPFPSYCTTTFSAQEKVLAYMMFDMTSCVKPPDLTCKPLTCADQKVLCGPAGDGCGGVIDCGTCTCVPPTCEALAAQNPTGPAMLTPTAGLPANCDGATACGQTVRCFCPG